MALVGFCLPGLGTQRVRGGGPRSVLSSSFAGVAPRQLRICRGCPSLGGRPAWSFSPGSLSFTSFLSFPSVCGLSLEPSPLARHDHFLSPPGAQPQWPWDTAVPPQLSGWPSPLSALSEEGRCGMLNMWW